MRIAKKESDYILNKKNEKISKEKYNSIVNFFYGGAKHKDANLYTWIEKMKSWNSQRRNNE